MTLQELEKEVPKLLDYTKTMPEELRRLSHVKIHPPGSLIHQKDYALNYLGIVAKGDLRDHRSPHGKYRYLPSPKRI